jgi:hypothetical protein
MTTLKVLKGLAVIGLLSVSTHSAADRLTNITPPMGALNPNVFQTNLYATVCVPGYSKTIRPPSSWTNSLKRGWTRNPELYELDHLVPISLGGSPTSEDNLWLELWPDARRKDKVEQQLHHDLCSGRTSLRAAQQVMLNWHR